MVLSSFWAFPWLNELDGIKLSTNNNRPLRIQIKIYRRLEENMIRYFWVFGKKKKSEK